MALQSLHQLILAGERYESDSPLPTLPLLSAALPTLNKTKWFQNAKKIALS